MKKVTILLLGLFLFAGCGLIQTQNGQLVADPNVPAAIGTIGGAVTTVAPSSGALAPLVLVVGALLTALAAIIIPKGKKDE